MINKIFTNLRLENRMNEDRRLSRVVVLFLMSGVVGSVCLSVRSAHAQANTAAVVPVPVASTFTIDVSGSAPALKTGLTEAITFSGPLVVTSIVSTDPTLGPGAVVSIDGRALKGIGSRTGKVYLNECEANLTRPFGAKDTIKTTFAFFEDAPGSYLNSKTGLLTLNLTYNTTTMTLTKVTASVSTL